MASLQPAAEFIGRLLLSSIFVIAGVQKIGNYDGGVAYMEAFGVPGVLMPLVIAAEVGLGLMLLAGFKTRLTAFLLGGFCVIAALIFHSDFAERMQVILFMKNMAIAGGMGVVFAHGAGRWSLDARNT